MWTRAHHNSRQAQAERKDSSSSFTSDDSVTLCYRLAFGSYGCGARRLCVAEQAKHANIRLPAQKSLILHHLTSFFFLFDMLNRCVMMVNRSSAKLILQTTQVSVATFLSPPKLHCQLTVEGGKGFYLGFSGMLIPASCINALSHSISAPFSGAHSWAFHTTTRGKKVQTCFCLPVSENESVLES